MRMSKDQRERPERNPTELTNSSEIQSIIFRAKNE